MKNISSLLLPSVSVKIWLSVDVSFETVAVSKFLWNDEAFQFKGGGLNYFCFNRSGM